MQRVAAESFLAADNTGQLIDVRSPAEFARGHIPGAVNVPIFDNLERARVGKAYKQRSREEAINVGLEIVGPKMKLLAEEAKKHAIDNQLRVYCWRGGMRSEKMAWLFELVGLQTQVLAGGYKAYRRHLHNYFSGLDNLIVLQGPTGSGKTRILHALQERGEQVLDLEALAHHKGSAFGGLGEAAQPTTQQFQNNIFTTLHKFDQRKPVWVESESVTIGRVYLPETLWRQMNQARVVAIEVPRAIRISNILAQYGGFSPEELIGKISQLQQKMGGANVKAAIGFVEQGDLAAAVDLLLTYYDKTYAHSAGKYKQQKPVMVQLKSADAGQNAATLLAQLLEPNYE